MKILNPNRFCVEVGEHLSYNKKAVDWMNNDLASRNQTLWPSAEELNKKNPKVVFTIADKNHSNRTFIEIWIGYKDNNYTGLSGVIAKKLSADIWFLNVNGTFLDFCPYPLFTRVK